MSKCWDAGMLGCWMLEDRGRGRDRHRGSEAGGRRSENGTADEWIVRLNNLRESA